MPKGFCRVCRRGIYIKPSHIQRGWGKYCSKICQSKAQLKGNFVCCGICNKKVWRTPGDFRHSKSGKIFCSKSCSAVWRNKTVLAGPNHVNWKHGESSYRRILLNFGRVKKCGICGITDIRILAVHHIDSNRKNNQLNNLTWLCHNCHHLVHHHKKEREKFMETLV